MARVPISTCRRRGSGHFIHHRKATYSGVVQMNGVNETGLLFEGKTLSPFKRNCVSQRALWKRIMRRLYVSPGNFDVSFFYSALVISHKGQASFLRQWLHCFCHVMECPSPVVHWAL